MKDIVKLFRVLSEILESSTITVDATSLEEGDLYFFIMLDKEKSLRPTDLNEISEFCDDLTINADQNGKPYLSLLFSEKTEKEEKE